MPKFIALAYKNFDDKKFSLSMVDFPLSVDGISNLAQAKETLKNSFEYYIEFEKSLVQELPVPTTIEKLEKVVSKDKEFHSFVEIEV